MKPPCSPSGNWLLLSLWLKLIINYILKSPEGATASDAPNVRKLICVMYVSISSGRPICAKL